MSLVAHKYTPAEMSDHELEATFAAREHTVEYLVKALRDQTHKGTLSSYVITGPRGAGKSTIIQMVDLRIRQDTDLSAAWMPVIFPEEQFNLISLRDLLAATLQILAKQNIPTAQTWLDKVEAEPDDEQSEQLAVTGLREIARQTGKRFVLFIENLNHLLEDHLDDKMKGTLRRLLMSDTFMMIVGSTVHIFDALKKYDEAFFNYFGQVPLNRLDAEQVSELLRKRATYDRNERFLRELPQQQAKVKTLVHLTGGNPRFVLMLYELLSLQRVTTIVQQLKRLVDELTPLLKDEMENLPPQQRKIIHALMERGGTAQPTDLTGPTRLPLNAITTQLKRLKEAQIVEVLGGGKGRAANYTVPDKLFSLWYQMRYLGQNRRRIELFVEVLRVWFEADERMETLRKLSRRQPSATPQALRDSAMTAEYLAASLKNSAYARVATEMCINHWITADLHEAAMAYADLSSEKATLVRVDELAAQLGFSHWLTEHGDFDNAIRMLDDAISKPNCSLEERAKALVKRGFTKTELGDTQGAMADFTTVIEQGGSPNLSVAWALAFRGAAKDQLGDQQGAMTDYTAIVNLEGIATEQVAWVLVLRAAIKRQLGDVQGEMADYTAAIELKGVTKRQLAWALVSRAVAKGQLGDPKGAMADSTAVIELEDAPKEQVVMALSNRGIAKGELGDMQGAIADYSAVIELEGAPKEQLARALVNRSIAKGELGDMQGAIADYSAVIKLEGAPKDQVSWALFNRGLAKCQLGEMRGAIADHTAVIQSQEASKEHVAMSLCGRALAFVIRGEYGKAVDDCIRALGLESTANAFISDCVVVTFGASLILNDRGKAEQILAKYSSVLNSLSLNQARELAIRFLSELVSPETKDVWSTAWRFLVANFKPELAEAVGFFKPVCSMLEGKDRTVLDALPPEQREFALEVLAKFEPKPEPKQEKAQKANYGKRHRSKK